MSAAIDGRVKPGHDCQGRRLLRPRRAPTPTPALERSISVTPERYSRSPSRPLYFTHPQATHYFLRSRTTIYFRHPYALSISFIPASTLFRSPSENPLFSSPSGNSLFLSPSGLTRGSVRRLRFFLDLLGALSHQRRQPLRDHFFRLRDNPPHDFARRQNLPHEAHRLARVIRQPLDVAFDIFRRRNDRVARQRRRAAVAPPDPPRRRAFARPRAAGRTPRPLPLFDDRSSQHAMGRVGPADIVERRMNRLARVSAHQPFLVKRMRRRLDRGGEARADRGAVRA